MTDQAPGDFKVPNPPKSTSDDSSDNQEKDGKTIEQEQEAKLMAKYSNLPKRKGPSSFLQKRLQSKKQYFDSGDYNMAKAQVSHLKKPIPAQEKVLLAQESTGDAIPTPKDLHRKPSTGQSKLVVSPQVS